MSSGKPDCLADPITFEAMQRIMDRLINELKKPGVVDLDGALKYVLQMGENERSLLTGPSPPTDTAERMKMFRRAWEVIGIMVTTIYIAQGQKAEQDLLMREVDPHVH